MRGRRDSEGRCLRSEGRGQPPFTEYGEPREEERKKKELEIKQPASESRGQKPEIGDQKSRAAS